jgi:large subunit ribosomal protein L15
VNIGDLSRFQAGSVVEPQSLRDKGLLRNLRDRVKVLGDGEISVGLTVRAHGFSKSAVEKIEKAGGKAEYLQAKSGKA